MNRIYIHLTKTVIQPSTKGILTDFLWKEYLILVFADMIGVVAALPSAWSVIEKTAALGITPSASSGKEI